MPASHPSPPLASSFIQVRQGEEDAHDTAEDAPPFSGFVSALRRAVIDVPPSVLSSLLNLLSMLAFNGNGLERASKRLAVVADLRIAGLFGVLETWRRHALRQTHGEKVR